MTQIIDSGTEIPEKTDETGIPKKTNGNVKMEEIIRYVMETPENVNGNILREKLKEFKEGDGASSVLDDLIEGKHGIHLVSNAESVAAGALAYYIPEFGPKLGLGLYLESVDLPNATSIGESAFDSCSALTSVNLPNATSIGESAFDSCSALTSVNLPNVTSIDESAFGSCSALTSVNLPNVTSIGAGAFDGISPTAVINIGAAEGEISGAPWGASSGVTINFTDGSITVNNK